MKDRNNNKTNTTRYGLAASTATLFAALAASPAGAAEGEFLALGDNIGGMARGSQAYGVSGDGSVVVGWIQSAEGVQAFRWTASDGVVGLGDLPGGYFTSRAYGVNGDGSVVVGTSINGPSSYEAFRWTASGGMVGLGYLSELHNFSYAFDVSSDGSVVVGSSNGNDESEAFRWTQSGGMVGLGHLPGYISSSATGVNSDGSVVVGANDREDYSEAFRWTQSGGMVGLGHLSGDNYSWATDVSGDGSVVVGKSNGSDGDQAFRWTQSGGMVGLGYLAGGSYSGAAGVNGDGSVVVGGSDSSDGYQAFRWTAASGMQSVTDWLASTGVAVADGFIMTATDAMDVSDDGNVLVGYGRNSSNANEAWMARGGSGVLSLNDDLTQSLASSGQGLAQVKQQMDLMLNGAHHRPLMDSAMPGSASCGWISGDLAHYGHDRDANSALGEVGFCNRLRSNELMVGVGLGKNYTDEETAFSGDTDIDGQYLLGEVDYRPAGSSLLYSLTAMVGSWDADIERGYMNAGAEDSSNGNTDIEGASLRARVDWLNAWRMGDTSLTPRVQYGLTRTRMDGYTETGGGFPVRFDARDHTAQELRLGVRSDHVLNGSTTLHGDVEVVHRFDDSNAGTSGQVVGLFGFDLPGSDVNQDWLRVGVEVDHRLGKNRTISASLHVSSEGEDPSYSAGVSLKFGLD